ncbi:MAG: TatD family hydrolase [Oligoflexia bacterium]|nr:TatD family hydrolase [Oligoflexia bacterium]
MFDAHNHLDRCADPLAELAAARRCGITGQLVAGVDPAGWREQAALQAESGVFVAFGIHPWTIAQTTDQELTPLLDDLGAALGGALGTDPIAPIALGEFGLDRSRRVPRDSMARQERAFRAQLAMARERDLPVILHVVRAQARALELIRRDGLPSAGGMLHSVSAPAELVPDWLGLGLYLSFSGSLTRHDRVRRAAAVVPLDRLLIETDAPDQPPLGQPAPNRPACLIDVIHAIAELRDLSPDRVSAATTRNAHTLLRLC